MRGHGHRKEIVSWGGGWLKKFCGPRNFLRLKKPFFKKCGAHALSPGPRFLRHWRSLSMKIIFCERFYLIKVQIKQEAVVLYRYERQCSSLIINSSQKDVEVFCVALVTYKPTKLMIQVQNTQVQRKI